MKKVLLIQSRRRPDMVEAEQNEYTRSALGEAEFTFVSALDESVPWDDPKTVLAGYDAVIIGGSGEFDLDGGRHEDDEDRKTARVICRRLEPLVDHVIVGNVPTLGVCFGHQLIGDVLGGNVRHDSVQKKVGTHDVGLTDVGKEDALLQELPSIFPAQYGHKDSITNPPRDAVVLARGSGNAGSCEWSALRYRSHVYTVQFHPELSAEDVFNRLQNSPGYLPEGVKAESIVRPSPEASRIIPLFIERIAR